MSRFGNFLVLLFFFMIPVAFLHPATELEIEVVPGFSGFVKPNHWIPFRVTLGNEGRHIKGALHIELGYGSEETGNSRTGTFVRPLDLPTRSRKTFSFVVFLESMVQPVWVRVFDGDTQIQLEKVDLRGHGVYERLVVVLSREISLNSLARLGGVPQGGSDFPASETSAHSRFWVVYPLAEHMPDRWNGYDSVDLLVIHNTPFHRLTVQQVRAIEKWIALGGTVVIAGGAHLSPEVGLQLKSIMPVEVLGLKEMSDLHALEELYRSEIGDVRKFLVTYVRPTSGTVLLEQDGVPLIVSEKRGRGQIFFFAFDYSSPLFDKWSGKDRLWHDVLNSRFAGRILPTESGAALMEKSLVSPVLNVLPLSFPSHAVLLVFLVLTAGTLNLLLRLRAPRCSAVLGVCLAAAAFSTLGYFVFHSWLFKRETMAIEVSVLETSPGQRYGLLCKDLLMITTENMLSCLSLPGSELSVVPGGKYDVIIEEDKDATRLHIPVDRWASRLCRIYSAEDFPVAGKVSSEGSLTRVSLRNDTSHILRDSLLIFRGFPYFLGDLPPGDSVKQVFSSGTGDSILKAPEWRDLVQSESANAGLKLELLEQLLVNGSLTDTLRSGDAVLAGWLGEDPMPLEISPKFRRNIRLSLVTIAMSPEGGGDVDP